MIDFSKPSITNAEISEIERVLKSKWITTGRKTAEFEQKINRYIGSKYCVPVSSCTAALHLALLCAGVTKGDEVITTPFTFTATANAILYVGAKPIFVDIKLKDNIIDEDLIEKKITPKTRAIIAVHYGGFAANLDKLKKICKKYNLKLIEDAAHAFGSKYKTTYIGHNSDYCCFSFYPTKNITTVEGGAFVTNNKKTYLKAKALALHGISKDAWKRYTKDGTWKYDVDELGYKYNLSDINSALGLIQLKRIKQMQSKREVLFKFYKKELSSVKQISILEGNTYSKPFRHLFVISVNSDKISRDALIERLKVKNIICSVHFMPLYHFSLYKRLFNYSAGLFPITEKVFNTCVSLPFGADLSLSDARKVVYEIRKIFS